MRDSEVVEDTGAAKGPRHVVTLLVESSDIPYRHSVNKGNSNRHCRVQQTLVDFGSDIERSRQGVVSWWGIECLWVCSRVEAKQVQWWVGRIDRVGRARFGRNDEHCDDYRAVT